MVTNHSLLDETLITLTDAAKDFGGIEIPLNTLKRYVYQGVKGLKLESILINGRYTSKEAIKRFIIGKQGVESATTFSNNLTSKQVEDGLRRHGIIK